MLRASLDTALPRTTTGNPPGAAFPAVTDAVADRAAPTAAVSTDTTASPPAGHAAAAVRCFAASVPDVDGAFAGTFVTGTDFPPAGAAGTGHAGGCAAAGSTTNAAATRQPTTPAANNRDREGTHRRLRTPDTKRADADMKPPRTRQARQPDIDEPQATRRHDHYTRGHNDQSRCAKQRRHEQHTHSPSVTCNATESSSRRGTPPRLLTAHSDTAAQEDRKPFALDEAPICTHAPTNASHTTAAKQISQQAERHHVVASVLREIQEINQRHYDHPGIGV